MDDYEINLKGSITENDIELVKQTWKSIDNLDHFGVTLFITLFANYQEIKEKWIFTADLKTERDFLKSPELSFHAYQVIKMIDRLIAKLDSLDSLNTIENDIVLKKLGNVHFRYAVCRTEFFVCFLFIFTFETTIIYKRFFFLKLFKLNKCLAF